MKKYRWMIRIIAFVVALLALLLIATTIQIDDWSRDLSQNRAETSADATDERLRSLVLKEDQEAAVSRIESVVAALPKWSFVSKQSQDGCEVIALTRTSGLFQFVDDVKITICPHQQGSVVDAISQSRVGKGDLGQNPRNIDQLFEAIRKSSAE